MGIVEIRRDRAAGHVPIGLEAALPKVPTRAQIVALERHLLDMPALELEPVHHFAKGIYARELRIPAGTVLTGKVHRTEHLNVLSSGDITVWTEDGMKRLQAPATMVSRPGTKRVGYAHTDTVWITIHGTNETDLDALEAELIDNDLLAGLEPVEALEGKS